MVASGQSVTVSLQGGWDQDGGPGFGGGCFRNINQVRVKVGVLFCDTDNPQGCREGPIRKKALAVQS